jgi:GNAT superfamily N-acetyltransferase
MKHLVTECKRLAPNCGVPHIGDLDWWVFYDTSGVPIEKKVRLWQAESGDVLAWTFIWLMKRDFEMVVHPSLRGTPDEEAILVEAENYVTGLALNQPESERAINSFAYDSEPTRIHLFEQRGYSVAEHLVYHTQPLNVELPEPRLPEGFSFLPAMREEYADKRADVHFNSFNPSKMTPAYYRGFMKAPGYDPELDTVVVAPDGRFASFAMGWLDPVNKIGTFEPVGTRTEFQRLGLGKAALHEGMRRLKARGMHTATVGCHAHNPGNLAFYQSAGFNIEYRVRSYTKKL